MLELVAHQNQYLEVGNGSMRAVWTLRVSEDGPVGSAPPLALAIVIDRSASMDGRKIRAATDAAIRVVDMADEKMIITVVAFDEHSEVLVSARPCTPENKPKMQQAIASLRTDGGTCMSAGLRAVTNRDAQFGRRVRRMLFLTDGQNRDDTREQLEQAVQTCCDLGWPITAWGIGLDWDEDELRYISRRTMGIADIIPQPDELENAFKRAFVRLQRTVIADARLSLWLPKGARVERLRQVHPEIVELPLQSAAPDDRAVSAALGALASGDVIDLLIELRVPVHPPGQQFLVCRPSFVIDGRTEASPPAAWLYARWTDEAAQHTRVDEQVAHYSDEERLSKAVRAGEQALRTGDRVRATAAFKEAMRLGRQTGNQGVTNVLSALLETGADGHLRLRGQVDEVARKTLAIRAGKTTRRM